MKIILLLLIGTLAAIPPLIGQIGKKITRERIKEIEQQLNKEGKFISLIIQSHEAGFLESKVSLNVQVDYEESRPLPSAPANSAQPFKFNFSQQIQLTLSNLPDLQSLKEGKLRFNFAGSGSKVEIESPDMTLHKVPIGLPKEKITFDEVRFNGGFYWPSGTEVKAAIDAIASKEKILSIKNLWLKLSMLENTWTSSLGFDQLAIDFKIFKGEAANFLLEGKQEKGPANGGSMSLKVTLDSPSLKIPGGIKIQSQLQLNKVPEDPAEWNAQRAFELGIKGSFEGSIQASSSKIAIQGEGEVVKDEESTEPAEQFIPALKGAVSLLISGEDKGLPLIASAVKMLESRADTARAVYGVELLAENASIPFELKGDDFYINQVRYFNCKLAKESGRQFSPTETASLPMNTLLAEAMEDLLVEEDPSGLAESYCRLKYVKEVLDKKNALAELLYTLMDVRLEYKLLGISEELMKTKVKTLGKAARPLEKEEELIILTSFFHCFIAPKGQACLDKKELITHVGEDHPFKKLTRLYYSTNADPEMVKAIVPEETRPEHIKRLYSFFKTKILHNALIELKQGAKLSESIKANAPLFSRNFLSYETMRADCALKDHQACITSIEQGRPSALPAKLKEVYVSSKVKAIRESMKSTPDFACEEAIEGIWSKLAEDEKGKLLLSMEWQTSSLDVQYLQKECRAAAFRPTPVKVMPMKNFRPFRKMAPPKKIQ